MFSSSLTLSTVIAISLTQIFRVGDYFKERLSAKH
jgi:hypothetical protein